MGTIGRAAERFRNGIGRFSRDEKGTIAIVTALTLISSLVVVGGAIDIYRFESERKRVQASFDRCVLAVARLNSANGDYDPGTASQAEKDAAEQKMRDSVRACLERADVTPPDDASITIQNDLENGDRGIKAAWNYSIDTTFLQLAGIEDIGMTIESGARDTEQYVEISLVLDLSGSMSNDVSGSNTNRRIDALKPAASAFVDTLLSNSGDTVTSINLVPYSSGINIGPRMFAELGIPRSHNFHSCPTFSTSSNRESFSALLSDGSLDTSFSGTSHAEAAFASAGTGRLHEFDRDFYGTPPGYEARNYGKFVNKRSDVNDAKTFYPDKDRSNEPRELWFCPDDTHAYMLKPYVPIGVIDRGRNTTVSLDGTQMPLHLDELFDHIRECDLVSTEYYVRRNRNNWNTYSDPIEHCVEDPSRPSISVRTPSSAQRDGHLAVDVNDAEVRYLSSDRNSLKQSINGLDAYFLTATDDAMLWAYALLHPDMADKIENADDDSDLRRRKLRDGSDEPSGTRPREFYVPGTTPPGSVSREAKLTKKYIVLLTDGLTTGKAVPATSDLPNYKYKPTSPLYGDNPSENWRYGANWVNNETGTKAEKRFHDVCEKAREKNITIFTIAYALDSATGKAALEKCADGSGGKSYVAGANIQQVFAEIAGEINRLKLVPFDGGAF